MVYSPHGFLTTHAASDIAGHRAVCECFLNTLGKTGNASAACRASGLSRRQLNMLKQRDPVFATAYSEALDEAADVLEAEAWRRALEGIPHPVMKAGQPVFDQSTGEAVTVQRYSDPLLVLLLRGCKPAKFAQRTAASGAAPDPYAAIREIAADDDPPRASTR
ncbi:hypothetical protein [Lichenicola sp.]|uniref:hypothetical protein n=1 Tax=Lichenicola sp. TaxID=2804529 RepID=UPI003B009353